MSTRGPGTEAAGPSRGTPGAPASTYRVQLHPGFGFRELAAQADYLAALGVTHVYLSPILQAVPGSTHGYDVVDHTALSRDLGGAEGFAELRAALERHGLQAVADVVPNHMAAPTEPAQLNPRWAAVLRDGQGSAYSAWFDIDWDAGAGRVLLPVLGDHLAHVLAAGDISVDRAATPPVLRYYDHVLPVRPGTEDRPLPELLAGQAYRLAHWRAGADELNYRRFFDVTTLAGVRVEDERVFAETHGLLLDLVRDGALAGLRIDHPDGLADPRGYLRRLAEATEHTGRLWVVVEKILEAEEQLPADWVCAGTTGYDAVSRVGGVFVDPAGEEPLTTFYTSLTGEPREFAAVVEAAKRLVVADVLPAEVRRLVDGLERIVRGDELLGDHTRRGLKQALVELLVAFPVYRAYVVPGEDAPAESVRVLDEAVEQASSRLPGHRLPTLELIRDIVLGRPVGGGRRGAAHDEVVVRFQQTCGPVMAKGVEDTALYRWFRFAALNEVGGDPATFGASVDALHAWCAARQRDRPGGLTALSTHDTKRAEDVRARLSVLSEVPEEWARAVTRWRAGAASHRSRGLDANTEYLFWQSLVGVLPAAPLKASATDEAPARTDAAGALDERLPAYLEKAIREAKRHTSWVDPDEGYETAVRDFAVGVLGDDALLGQVREFVARLAPAVRVVTLGQKLLQLTVPGVPDLYQGTELVTLALVDPDNRRPVDYAARRALLAAVDGTGGPGLDAVDARDSLDAEKLLVVAQTLRLRREHSDWFGNGSYQPVPLETPHAVAFLRGERVVTVVTRLGVGLERAGGWGAQTVALPPGRWTDEFTGASYAGVAGGAGGAQSGVPLRDVLRALPVALLVRSEETSPAQ